jgi:hypothetical protein
MYTHTYVRIHMQHNETIKHCLKKGRTERGKWKYDGGGKYTVCIYGIIKMKLLYIIIVCKFKNKI